MATTKRAPKAKPAKRVDRRKTTSTRITPETRGQIEEAAAQSGRSLAQEIEFRLERSLQQEADSGGRQLHGLLRLLIGAAEIIQARTGKSASDDWKTGIAVGSAWKRLIHDWLPRPPAELIAEMERLSDNIPDAPELPEMPARGGLLVSRASDEEWEAYGERLQNFEKDQDTFVIACDEHKAALRKIQDEFKKAAGIGEEALGLLSDKKNRR